MDSHASRRHSKRLAVLIDADNASAKIIDPLLREVAKFGVANVKRVYGDWTTPNLGAWKSLMPRFALQPIQQFRYTVGKNASDSALIIDAMDLLYSGNLDGFCIVSSDSDFTRLASRLRESGVSVYGFGERKTPDPFVQACDRFIYVEDILPPAGEAPPGPARADPTAVMPKAAPLLDPECAELIRATVAAITPEGGWTSLAELGDQIRRRLPSFSVRACGYRSLSELIGTIDGLRLDRKTHDGGNGQKQWYVAPDPYRRPEPVGAVSEPEQHAADLAISRPRSQAEGGPIAANMP